MDHCFLLFLIGGCTLFLWSPLFESRRSLIILMSLDELSFIVVVIAMELELQHLVIGSTYFYGAEGDFTCCLISLLLQFV